MHRSRWAGLILAIVLVSGAWAADEKPRLHAVPEIDKNPKTGPPVGSRIPAFDAIDQNGKRQTFETLRGPKGLTLLFVRSADWCPFCKTQLVELGQQQEAYRKIGLGVASVSYDSAPLLQNFAGRKGLHYPMLSDPQSKLIRAFDILNDNFPRDNEFFGVPFPGMYIVDQHGVVKAKYFEDDHRERYTAASVLLHEFGEGGLEKTIVETPHLKLSYSATDASLSPGERTSLILDLDLKPGLHVYAPGVEGGYIPIDWKMPESTVWLAQPVSYPASRKLHLAAINETVPVYEGHVRMVRDLTVGQLAELRPLLNEGKPLVVEGTFRYQACDEKECYPPRNIPLQWTIPLDKLDSQRAPEEMQRKTR